jgi:cytochrome P450
VTATGLEELQNNPYPALARLRAHEPVAWVAALETWLVTRFDLAVQVMRDPRTFTVDDPRFTTAKVVGPSMLSLDGPQHTRHRDPFTRAFRAEQVHARLADFTQRTAVTLVSAIRPQGCAELRRSVAGPLAVRVMSEVLGLGQTDPATVLSWYDDIVSAVTGQGTSAAGATAFGKLSASLEIVIRDAANSNSPLADAVRTGKLRSGEAVSNAAVLLFGGIDTTEGMITNAALHLLSHPGQLALVRAQPVLLPAAIEESLRLEPAAAVVDRYATRDVEIGGSLIRRGDPVTVSITAANRDPEVFPDPDQFDIRRDNAGRHLAFAHGPHFCLGAHLARLEAHIALATLLDRLPGLRLDPQRPVAAGGLVFRKPSALHVRWDTSR